MRTREDAGRYILAGPMASYDRFGFGLYRVERKDGGEPIGMCGLLKRDSLEDVDVGFAFLPRSWSNGFAFESAAAVLAHGRRTWGLKRILAITSPDNEASIRLLAKARLSLRADGATVRGRAGGQGVRVSGLTTPSPPSSPAG